MALAVTQRVIFTMVDAKGTEGGTSLNIEMDAGTDPTTSAAAYIALLNAASNCKVKSVVGQTGDNEDKGTKEANDYNVRDKLSVEYVGSQNDHHIMTVGDLQPAILDPTNFENVDPTNSLWLALKGAIQTNMVDKIGESVKVIRGFRTRSRNLRLKTIPDGA